MVVHCKSANVELLRLSFETRYFGALELVRLVTITEDKVTVTVTKNQFRYKNFEK